MNRTGGAVASSEVRAREARIMPVHANSPELKFPGVTRLVTPLCHRTWLVHPSMMFRPHVKTRDAKLRDRQAVIPSPKLSFRA